MNNQGVDDVQEWVAGKEAFVQFESFIYKGERAIKMHMIASKGLIASYVECSL